MPDAHPDNRARERHSTSPGSGPPWPRSRDELDAFATGGVTSVEIEEIPDSDDPELHRWRAEFQRPLDTGAR